MKLLIIFNREPYDNTDVTWNGLRLAGKLLEAGFIIDTSHAREMVTGGGRTTAAIAASFFGKVIKVSQDGPIELYEDGRLVYRFG